jgi:UDP-N-acetylmuramoylalanine--D-glutamate ligase
MFGFAPEKPILVYGLGASGRAAVRALAQAGYTVWAHDDNESPLPPEYAAHPHVLRHVPQGAEWESVQALIKAPGISPATPLVADALARGIKVMGETDLLWRREKNSGAIWLGVTGTNGKSTTTALVGHILRSAGKVVAMGGNLGIPALDLPSLGVGGFYVLELSSFQLEMLHEMAADGAVLLNLTPDHLDRHHTMEAYLKAKLRLFDLAAPDATKVLGVDQPALAAVATQGGLITIGSQNADYTLTAGAIMRGNQTQLIPAHYPMLPGPHNAQNIMAALGLLVPRWLTLPEFLEGLKTFKGLPHRLEKVGTLGGVKFINDSKATNGDSAVYALQSYPHIYWVCGGKPKTDGLGACLNHLGAVRAAFTIGEAGPEFAAAIKAKGTAAFVSQTLQKAVTEAYAAARTEHLEGAVVLLSPAAASYDQFRNFEHRGDTFANCVRHLAEQDKSV